MATMSIGVESSVALGNAVAGINMFLPKLSEVRKWDIAGNPEQVADLRMSEVGAIAVGMGTAIILASITRTNMPIVVAGAMLLVIVAVYETALRTNRAFERKDNA